MKRNSPKAAPEPAAEVVAAASLPFRCREGQRRAQPRCAAGCLLYTRRRRRTLLAARGSAHRPGLGTQGLWGAATYCSPGCHSRRPLHLDPPTSPKNCTWTVTLKPLNSPSPLKTLLPPPHSLSPPLCGPLHSCPKPTSPPSSAPPLPRLPPLGWPPPSLPCSCPYRLGISVSGSLSPRPGVREKGRIHFPNQEVVGTP